MSSGNIGFLNCCLEDCGHSKHSKFELMFVQTILDWHMPIFTSKCFHVLVSNKVAGTMYQLKLSALCDLLDILSSLGPEASGSSG